jgi:hypothetical protein
MAGPHAEPTVEAQSQGGPHAEPTEEAQSQDGAHTEPTVEAQSQDDDSRAVLTSVARTLAVRYAILMPKFKAVAFLQPEDHVSKKRIIHDAHRRGSYSAQLFVSASHNAAIFASGAVLFLVQDRSLRTLEPQSRGDFSLASPFSTFFSGALGGMAYSLCATCTAAWVGTKGASVILEREKRLRSWAFLRMALPYTLARDCGGFALYFGTYAFAQSAFARRLGVYGSCTDAASEHKGAELSKRDGENGQVAFASGHAGAQTSHKLQLLTSSPGELARGVGAAAASGGLAGLLSYAWRSPLDTLYKRAVGWRAHDAPLWSLRRFLTSPRGGKAVLIGATTWSAFEIADAGVRALAGEGHGAHGRS